MVLLGAPWLMQGLGLITAQPVLCVADCEPLVGPSVTWALAGIVAVAAGLAGLRYVSGGDVRADVRLSPMTPVPFRREWCR